MTIISTMAKLIFTMLLGLLLNKTGLIDGSTSKKLSALVVQVTSPMLIVASVSGISGNKEYVLVLLIIGISLYLITPVLGFVLSRLLPVPKNQRAVYTGAIIFSNCSFMGYPIVQAIFGDAAIFYVSIIHIPFNFLFYTFQMAMYRRTAVNEGLLPEIKDEKTMGRKIRDVLNNGVIAAVAALILYFGGLKLPALVNDTLSFIGNMTMPLSMIAIGSSIGNYSIKEILSEKMVYPYTIIRLVIMPVLANLIIRLFIQDPMTIGMVTITVGMPVASLIAMGAAQYREQGKTAAILVAFSTICSMITVPVMGVLLGL